MTRKMARSAPPTTFRAARGAGSRLHLASALQEGRENAEYSRQIGGHLGNPSSV